jgi:hypothetical protein
MHSIFAESLLPSARRRVGQGRFGRRPTFFVRRSSGRWAGARRASLLPTYGPAAILNVTSDKLTDQDLARMKGMIERARREGR